MRQLLTVRIDRRQKRLTVKYVVIQVAALALACLLIFSGCGKGGGSDSTPSFSVSGTIQISGHTAVDSDVNDAYETAPLPQSNNSFTEAQDISVPVKIGGFVTVADDQAEVCPEGGRLCSEGDTSDFYKTTLSGDWTINLYWTDELTASLYLYDAQGTELASDSGQLNELSIEVGDTDGEYYVEVRAISGASNYILAFGSTLSASASRALSSDQEFVPGEFLVKFKQSEIGTLSNTKLKAQELGFSVVSKSNTGPVLVQMEESQKEKVFKSLNLPAAVHTRPSSSEEIRVQRKRETIEVIEAMRKRSDVLYAEPNYILKPLMQPNDNFYDLQWHYPLIGLPDAWDLVATAATTPVVVAVVDTGVLLDHPDLEGQLTSDGYDFITDPESSNDGDGIDPDPNDSGDQLQNGESTFHGTHVSGTIAAASNNSIGGAGVTWQTQTKIMPVRALGAKDGTSADVLEAVKYAAGLENDSGTVPNQPADIINLSLGGSSYSEAEADVFSQVRNQGIIVVAAAGNTSSSLPVYPAAYPGVISVSAVDINAELAPYSNFGTTIDVAAPGGDNSQNLNGDLYADGVLSTMGKDSSGTVQFGYSILEGTSMAAPHVAGVIALMKSISPEMTPDEFDDLLVSGALTTDIGTLGKDSLYGYGLIDAYRSVLAVMDDETPTELMVSPGTLSFGSQETQASLTAQMVGSGTLNITSVDADASWITVTAETDTLDSDPETEIPSTTKLDVQIQRPAAYVDGVYTATITIVTNKNTIEVPVSMQKIATDQSSDAGFLYIVLINSDTRKSEFGTVSTAQNGTYTFQIDLVEPGQYFLAAGTDMDNDGYLNDGGAFGIYPSLEEPEVFEVSGDLSGLDFLIGFNIQLSSLLGNTSNQIKKLQKTPENWMIKKRPD